ncbi:hypothetical protein [Ruminiclostridium hungatei]|uniref:hypothetical protein n=1 Tax=Ruminiclostridium hungatei TaxID=48256 RepID=UPI0009ABFF35|nr:hypothetical protein [Ruminiclostridium hungatei]
MHWKLLAFLVEELGQELYNEDNWELLSTLREIEPGECKTSAKLLSNLERPEIPTKKWID